ncbi:aluminum-activated malate transporter 9-like isoform X2 [Henckelia pumila]|uniref:aluminum-activated malate transporter 9-like isoform X2 n=1 Tax=Henckelia pumila TaxID=405737 RepID=UPI003C6E5759
MNGKKGSVEIKMPSISKQKISDCNRYCVGGVDFSCKSFVLSVREFCKEDVDRVTFSLKVGLAVLVVSLLILCATFNRGFNRALGSLVAGVMAIVVAQIALSTGHVAEPIIIGFSIFIVGTVTSFMKLWPSLVPYEYGFRVMLFTYCLIIVSGYRMGSPFRTAMDRLYSIAIGGIVAVSVNLLIFPIWAGEQLHKELVNNFASVADALEECVRKYLQDDGSEQPEFTKTVMDEVPDEPAYRKCRSTLNSASKFETLANSAKWEPPHGRFNHFFYPWSEYVKVGAVLRYCAYEVMALHGVLHSEIQAPYNLRITFQKEIQEASSVAAELVRYLGQDIANMQWSLKSCLLKRVHLSTEKLQRAIDMHSYLLTSTYDPPDNSSMPQTRLAHALSSTFSDSDSKPLAQQNFDPPNQLQGSTVPLPVESCHETTRKQSRRQYSWPSREVDAFEDDRSFNKESVPKMQALESTTNLSLATFTSLLIEFVARLDHLVEAVDELSNMAKFKHGDA